ncbi:MAG TPA: alcohol dehydrogenase catalytic domain-containing protein [bacterium]|nr:alcohol dehydrogenase catalytic domain-containing protein [bacterium]
MYYNNHDVRLEEYPTPRIGPDELLVKVRASGVCGTDVLEWYRLKQAPRVLGHEIAGDIVEAGKDVKGYHVGDRVFVSHHVPCNTCHYCLAGNHTVCETLHTTNFDPGGFAEYVRIPRINVDRGTFVLPPGMTYEDGVFIEPVACVVRGQRLARLRPGQTVLILGSGLSGLLHLALARAAGVTRIILTDVNEFRLDMARRFGATAAVSAKGDVAAAVRQHNNGRLADMVIVCTGAFPAFKQALDAVDRGGTVLCFATTEPGVDLPVPINKFWRNGVTLMPSYACSPRDISIAIELLAAGKFPVQEMITHRLPLEETTKGFVLVAEAGDSMKVIIEPFGE